MNHDDIESKLTDAFGRRGHEVGAVQPSLAEVHRRASRHSARRGAVRASALVAASLAVVGLGFVASSRGDRTTPAGDAVAPVATQEAPVPTATVPGNGAIGWDLTGADGFWTSVPLTAELLWESVASRYAMSLEALVAANPGLDISRPPLDGQVINLPTSPPATTMAAPTSTAPGDGSASPATWPEASTTVFATAPADATWPAAPVATTLPPTSTRVLAAPTSTAAAWQECTLTDEEIAQLVEHVRSLPGSGATAPPTTAPAIPAGCGFLTNSVPEGWTLYAVVPGDTLYGVARQRCTTVQAIVDGNGWSGGTQTAIYPGALIAVPTC